MKQVLVCISCQRDVTYPVKIVLELPGKQPEEIHTLEPASNEGTALKFVCTGDLFDDGLCWPPRKEITWLNVNDLLNSVTSSGAGEYQRNHLCLCGEIIGREDNALFQYFQPDPEKTFWMEYIPHNRTRERKRQERLKNKKNEKL